MGMPVRNLGWLLRATGAGVTKFAQLTMTGAAVSWHTQGIPTSALAGLGEIPNRR